MPEAILLITEFSKNK